MADSITNEFIQLVKIDSPSGNERRLADYLTKRLADFGVSLSEDGTGKTAGGNAGNLHGLLPGDDRDPILLCAHMDTVRSNEGVEVTLEDGIICTQNQEHILGGDDKAGIAAIIELVRRLTQETMDHPPVEILFTIEEETGLWGSKHFDVTKLASKAGFVLDAGAPVGTVVNRSPVHNEFKLKVYGRAAHAGNDPEHGVNAIQIASRIVASLSLGRIDEYTTANIGKISGGAADNIIPDYAELSGEIRSHEPSRLESYKESLVRTGKLVASKYGGRAEATFSESFPALFVPQNSALVTRAMAAAERLHLPAAIMTRGGGSDANILNGRGIDCVNLGIGVKHEHSGEESIAVSELTSLVQLLIGICQEW